MIKNAYDELGIVDFNKLNQHKQLSTSLSSGCPVLDSFLQGGIKPGFVTEICGEAGSGKSQLALQIMLYATLSASGDIIQNYGYFVSTQKPHSDTRLNQLKSSFLQMNRVRNPKDLESHLIFKHATNLHDFNFWVNNDLSARLQEKDNIKVIIIDTIAGICSEFLGNNSRGTTSYDTLERKNFLIKTSQLLKKYAYQHNIAIIVLNNMVSNINEDSDMLKKEKLVPSLGLIWSNMVNERFKLKRVKTFGGRAMAENDIVKERVKRSFSVKFSPRLSKQKIPFYIENNGIFASIE